MLGAGGEGRMDSRGGIWVESLAQHVQLGGLDGVGRVLYTQAHDGETQLLELGWRSHICWSESWQELLLGRVN